MIKRNIINYQGIKIGELNFPIGTSEQEMLRVLSLYTLPPPSTLEKTQAYLNTSIKQRKEFSEDLLERFKQRNMLEGINADHAFWLHDVLRRYETKDMSGRDRVVDIFNTAITGDVEAACLALINGYTDNMLEPFHWFSGDRKQWLITEMKAYLGWTW